MKKLFCCSVNDLNRLMLVLTVLDTHIMFNGTTLVVCV